MKLFTPTIIKRQSFAASSNEMVNVNKENFADGNIFDDQLKKHKPIGMIGTVQTFLDYVNICCGCACKRLYQYKIFKICFWIFFMLLVYIGYNIIFFINYKKDYTLISNAIMYSMKSQIERDISLNIGSYDMAATPGTLGSHGDSNYGTRMIWGIGSYKGGTQYWAELSNFMIKKFNRINDKQNITIYRKDEVNYWHNCAFSNMIHQFGLSQLYFDTLIKTQFSKNAVAMLDCSWDNFIYYGWDKLNMKHFIDKNKVNMEPIQFYTKLAQDMYVPSNSLAFAMYSNYLNNLSNNKKYYPSGMIKFWIVLRNPTQRAYANVFWRCNNCLFNQTTKQRIIDVINQYNNNQHKHYSPMFTYINKIYNKINENDKIKMESKLNAKIISGYINGVYYDAFYDAINMITNKNVQKWKSLNDNYRQMIKFERDLRGSIDYNEYISFLYSRQVPFANPIIKSCYYLPIRMFFNFYHNSDNKNENKNKNNKNRVPVPLKIVQTDISNSETSSGVNYEAQLIQEFVCWVKDNCDKIDKKANSERVLKLIKNLDFKQHGVELHANKIKGYKPQKITQKLKLFMDDFYKPCNDILNVFLTQHNELFLDGFQFQPW